SSFVSRFNAQRFNALTIKSDFNSRTCNSCFSCVQFSENAPLPRQRSLSFCAVSPARVSARWQCASTFGGHKAVVRPVPIPNTAVKHSLADGSGFIDSARVGCRQFFLKSRNPKGFGFFIRVLARL